MDRVLERDVVVVSGTDRGKGAVVERSALIGRLGRCKRRRPGAYLFSRKVFALTMFFPIADAFHAQNEPDGSTW